MVNNNNFSETYIKKTMQDIMLELKNPEYSLSEGKITFLNSKSSNFLLSFIDSMSNNRQIVFKDEIGNLYHVDMVKNNTQSMVLEHPPLTIDKKTVNILPTILLRKFSNEDVFLSTTYHEICHFLSIGDWVFFEEEGCTYVKHTSGIAERTYSYNDGEPSQVASNKLDFLNELLNDWIAMNLYGSIQKKEYRRIYNNPEFYKYIDTSIQRNLNGDKKAFIGLYFSNSLKYIESILLEKNAFGNLHELNRYFEDKEKDVLEK